jgi:hypothetical protein
MLYNKSKWYKLSVTVNIIKSLKLKVNSLF